jgi:hypothetical protein
VKNDYNRWLFMSDLSIAELTDYLRAPLTPDQLDVRNDRTRELGGALVDLQLLHHRTVRVEPDLARNLDLPAARLLGTLLQLPPGMYVRQSLLGAVCALPEHQDDTKNSLSSDISVGCVGLQRVKVDAAGTQPLLAVDRTYPRQLRLGLADGVLAIDKGYFS